jgi:hypothetical protein
MRGAGFYGKAFGFDRTYAYAGFGRGDVARLYDSPSDDVFSGAPHSSVLRGVGYYYKVVNFDRVYARATAGSDLAYLHGSDAGDRFYAQAERQMLCGTHYYTEVYGFDRTVADALGSVDDVAYLYDTPQSDSYTATPGYSVWQGQGFHVGLRRFGNILARGGQSGNDIARVQVADRSAQFVGQADTAIAIAGQTRHQMRGFRLVTLDVENGRLAALYLSSLDFLFECIGEAQPTGNGTPYGK